jgi:hypothetical protein
LPAQGRPCSRRLQGDEEQCLLTQCWAARKLWLVHFEIFALEAGRSFGQVNADSRDHDPTSLIRSI